MNKQYIGDTFVLGSNTNNPNVSIVGVNIPEPEKLETSTSLITPLTTTSTNTITGSGLNFTSLNAGRIAIMPPKSLFYALYSNSVGITVTTSAPQVMSNWTSTLSTTSDIGASQSTGGATIETTGYYRLYAKVWWNTSTATSRNILFEINGTSTVYRNSSISQGQTSCEIDVVLYITASNVVFLYGSVNGASANVINYVYSIERMF